MTKGGVLALAVVCYMGFPVASQAACKRGGAEVFFQGETKVSDQVITDGSSCGHRFSVNPDSRAPFSYESASIALNPKHGTLQQTAEFGFSYKPNANYKGTDEYTLKVCGQRSGDKGCTTLNYKTTIQ